MFDTIVDTVRTEAAVQGPRGITSKKLWEIVQTTITKSASSISEEYASNPPCIDLAYKCCLWPILLQDQHLEFYEDLNTIVQSEPAAPQQAAQSTEEAPQLSAAVAEDTASSSTTTKSKAPYQSKAKGKSRAHPKRSKAPAKRKAAKKPAKKAKKRAADRDDDDYSSDGYEPPSDEEESPDDEEEYAEDSDEKDEEEDAKEKAAPEPKKSTKAEVDPLANAMKTNYKRIDDIKELGFDKVEQMYGTRLRVLADKNLQTEQLYIGTPPTARSMSSNLQIVFTVILQAGLQGITQAALTKVLDLDPRSAGHYVKVLEQKGAIIRKPINHNGIRTNICIHVRYSKQTDDDGIIQGLKAYNVNASGVAFTVKRLRARMIDLLTDAKDNVMYTDDILSALGFNAKDKFVKKWYHRSIDELCTKNVFRKVIGATTKSRTSRCVQLVDPNQAIKEMDSSPKITVNQYKLPMDDVKRLKGGTGLLLKPRHAENRPGGGQYYDTTVESQLVDVLQAAGTNGATQKEIMYTLSYGEQKAMHKLLEIMTGLKQKPEELKYTACRDFEFEGRVRRYRYYSYQAYQKLKNNIDVEVSGPPLYEIAASKLKEVDIFKQTSEFVLKKGACSRSKAKATQPKSTTEKASPEPLETTVTESQPPVIASSSNRNDAASLASESSSQPSKLAPIFQPRKKVTRNAASQDDNTQDNNNTETNTPATRKRARRGTLDTESSTSKAPKKRGQASRQTATCNDEATEQAELPALDTTAVEATKTPVRRGRSSKKQLETSDATIPIQAPEIREVYTATPVPPKKRGRLSKKQKTITASKETPDGPMLKNAEQTIEQPLPPTAHLESRDTSTTVQQLTEASTSAVKEPSTHEQVHSPPIVAASPRRGNLFDYFATSRGSPSSPRTDQGTRIRTYETLPPPPPPPPRSPGRLYQQLVEVRVNAQPIEGPDNQEDVDMQDQRDAINPSKTTVSATVSDHSQIMGKRKRKSNSDGTNVVRTKSGITSARHVRRGTNVYQEQRQKTLLALLEEQPIWDRSHELKKVFLEKNKQLYPAEARRPGLCMKTLWKTAAELAELGLAQLHELELTHLNGTQSTKLLVLRRDLDKNGPEVQEYTEFMREKKALRSSRARKISRYERLDNKVERLEERLERMEEEYDELEDKQGLNAMRLDEEIKLIKANIGKVTQIEETMDAGQGSTGNWLMIAIQFGFVPSRMIRAKLLHQHVFGLLSQDIDGVDRENKTIKASTIISWMTMQQYCQIIGVYVPYKALIEFTEDRANMDKYIWELPNPVKSKVFASAAKFRHRVRSHMDILKGLGVVKPKDMQLAEYARFGEDSKDLPDSYELITKVALRDYRTSDHRVLNEYTIETPSDIMIYWSDLQYICTNTDQSAEVPDAAVEETEEIRELKKILLTLKNWSPNIVTRELRDKLNTYIDVKEKTTPADNTVICKIISTELNVHVSLVQGYFKKMENAFERQQKSGFRKLTARLEHSLKPKRRRQRKRRDETNLINTNRVFERTTRGSTRLRLLKAMKEQAGDLEQTDTAKELYLDDETEIPFVESNNQVELARLRRVIRRSWTAEEDELLVYCYVIMKHHAKYHRHRFYWTVASSVIPPRTPQQMRHRFNKIRVLPAILEYILTLETLWPKLYLEGLDEGVYPEEPNDSVNYDILGQLSYFIQRLQDVNSAKARVILLPSTIESLHEMYDVERTINSANIAFKIEDQYHGGSSMRAKNRVLIKGYLTLDASSEFQVDDLAPEHITELKPQRRAVELLKAFNRMILLTPYEFYDPFFAHAVVSHQPNEIVQQAVNEMHSLGQIVKSKGERINNRRLPGMFWNLSKRYMNDMACTLPTNFFLQAKEYKKYLLSHGKSSFIPILISSGMMGCVLDLLSQHKLVLSLKDETQEREKYLEPMHKSRRLDPSVLDFDVDIACDTSTEDDNSSSTNILTQATPQSSCVTPLTHENMEVTWSGFCSSQAPSIRPILKVIMGLLQETQDTGATLFEIKDKLLETYPEMEDTEIRKCIKLLCESRPPFVHRVGFASFRYVTTNYLDNWVIHTRGLKALTPSSAEAADRANSMNEKRTDVIDTRLWVDINGSVTKDPLNESLQVVFQRVMERPGILEREVRRLFDSLLTYAEVKDLLDMLVACGAIRKLTMVSTGAKKNTLFSKPRKYTKAADPDVIDPTAQTSYFACLNFSQKLAQTQTQSPE
ncbi:hypothetical protein BDB00DRAFT_503846 [Zychaea mexicana]|uniref:uncharacterized protein n=1 Tax=Zychaea mexicana TaxID=64656 RepID=UPI0022FEC41B|nr:uncharacterized protein BDB00DRAFT_503846 [Zychaea mexicana]KAI9498215.1 hypothetical protein BDB00DRAFT_503846 [Zychaea mexicana]